MTMARNWIATSSSVNSLELDAIYPFSFNPLARPDVLLQSKVYSSSLKFIFFRVLPSTTIKHSININTGTYPYDYCDY